MIYTSAKISHWKWLTTSTLEFLKIKFKNSDFSDEINKTKKIDLEI
jgi:hypothetical protein